MDKTESNLISSKIKLTIVSELNGSFEYSPEIAVQPNLCTSPKKESKLAKAISPKLAGSPELSPEIAPCAKRRED